MGIQRLQRVDTGSSLAWLLKNEAGYLIRLRQKPENDPTREVALLIPLSAEWLCRTEGVARAAFRQIVALDRLSEALLREIPQHEIEALQREYQAASAILKQAVEETGDSVRIPREELSEVTEEKLKINLDRIEAALLKLARIRAVERLLRLNEVRKNPDLADDPAYRKLFIGYYRMGLKPVRFYERFFSMLRRGASSSVPPTLATILQELFETIEEKHLSFGSKMRATLTDDAVIFDKNVAAYFDVSSKPLPEAGWLDEALRRYEQIRQGIHAFIQRPDWDETRSRFERAFPNATHLPDARIADLIIWSVHEA